MLLTLEIYTEISGYMLLWHTKCLETALTSVEQLAADEYHEADLVLPISADPGSKPWATCNLEQGSRADASLGSG